MAGLRMMGGNSLKERCTNSIELKDHLCPAEDESQMVTRVNLGSRKIRRQGEIE